MDVNRREAMKAAAAAVAVGPLAAEIAASEQAVAQPISIIGYSRGWWLLSNGGRVNLWRAVAGGTADAEVVRRECASIHPQLPELNAAGEYDREIILGAVLKQERDNGKTDV
jgi:hypothetical protein